MRQFEITEQLFEKDITVQVLKPDQGLHVSILGGELSHIGAVSIVNPQGECSTVQFPGHKEGAICEEWAKELAKAGYCPVVVEAGIHYDHLSKAGIEDVMNLCGKLLADTILALSE
jgi:hypothetical protein